MLRHLHRWSGLLAAVLVLAMSLSGAALWVRLVTIAAPDAASLETRTPP